MQFIFIMPVPNQKIVTNQKALNEAIKSTCESIQKAINFSSEKYDFKIIIAGNEEKYNNKHIISISDTKYENSNNLALDKNLKKKFALEYVQNTYTDSICMFLEAGDLIANNFFEIIQKTFHNNTDVEYILFSAGLAKTEDKVLLVDGKDKKFYKNFASNAVFRVKKDSRYLFDTLSISNQVEKLVANNINIIFNNSPIVCVLADLNVSYFALQRNVEFIKNIKFAFKSGERINSTYRLNFG